MIELKSSNQISIQKKHEKYMQEKINEAEIEAW